MWDTIKSVLLSSNVVVILLFLCFIFIILLICIKDNLISINSRHVKLGNSESERAIIRQQIEWAHLHCEAFEKLLPRPANYNNWRSRYILERMYDEIIDWITFNHITEEGEYIAIKQERIWAIIQSLTEKEEYASDGFKEMIYKDVADIVKRLVQIRRVYK